MHDPDEYYDWVHEKDYGSFAIGGIILGLIEIVIGLVQVVAYMFTRSKR